MFTVHLQEGIEYILERHSLVLIQNLLMWEWVGLLSYSLCPWGAWSLLGQGAGKSSCIKSGDTFGPWSVARVLWELEGEALMWDRCVREGSAGEIGLF